MNPVPDAELTRFGEAPAAHAGNGAAGAARSDQAHRSVELQRAAAATAAGRLPHPPVCEPGGVPSAPAAAAVAALLPRARGAAGRVRAARLARPTAVQHRRAVRPAWPAAAAARPAAAAAGPAARVDWGASRLARSAAAAGLPGQTRRPRDSGRGERRADPHEPRLQRDPAVFG